MITQCSFLKTDYHHEVQKNFVVRHLSTNSSALIEFSTEVLKSQANCLSSSSQSGFLEIKAAKTWVQTIDLLYSDSYQKICSCSCLIYLTCCQTNFSFLQEMCYQTKWAELVHLESLFNQMMFQNLKVCFSCQMAILIQKSSFIYLLSNSYCIQISLIA